MTDYSGTAGLPPTSAQSPPLKDKVKDKVQDKVKDNAAGVAEVAKGGGAGVAQTASEQAKEVAQETGRQARDLVGEAREQVRQQAGAQHRSLVTSLRSLGEELGGMTAGSQQSGIAGEAAGQLRDRVQGAADWLEGREPGELIEELRRFARRRPGAFLVGAVAAGVVAGRLTRGVVAVHTDDTDDTDATPRSGFGSQRGPVTQPALAPSSQYPPVGEYAGQFSGYAAPTGNGEAGYGTQPGYGEAGYGTQPGYGTQAGGGTQPGYGTQAGGGTQPGGGSPPAGAAQDGEGWR
jgi:hypothetical protein